MIDHDCLQANDAIGVPLVHVNDHTKRGLFRAEWNEAVAQAGAQLSDLPVGSDLKPTISWLSDVA